MHLNIEKATINDCNIIISLLKELYLELGEEEESIKFLNEDLISEILESKNTEIFLAKINSNTVVGIMTLTESQAIYAGGKYGLIDEMYVLPSYRSKKIGELFIRKIKEIGKIKNWKRIDVTAPTEEKWVRTISFYKNSGFIFTGPKLKFSL